MRLPLYHLQMLMSPPRRTIEQTLAPEMHLGDVDMSSLEEGQKVVEVARPASTASSDAPASAAACLNLDDFEKAAERLLKSKAWGQSVPHSLFVSKEKLLNSDCRNSLLPQRSG